MPVTAPTTIAVVFIPQVGQAYSAIHSARSDQGIFHFSWKERFGIYKPKKIVGLSEDVKLFPGT
jgi:hypothetical protein